MSSSKLYDEIINILYEKFKDFRISKAEIERMVDSQFKVARESIGKKQAEVTMFPYLGKVVPTKAHQRYVNSKQKS